MDKYVGLRKQINKEITGDLPKIREELDKLFDEIGLGIDDIGEQAMRKMMQLCKADIQMRLETISTLDAKLNQRYERTRVEEIYKRMKEKRTNERKRALQKVPKYNELAKFLKESKFFKFLLLVFWQNILEQTVCQKYARTFLFFANIHVEIIFWGNIL